jgi:hypothetical protein
LAGPRDALGEALAAHALRVDREPSDRHVSARLRRRESSPGGPATAPAASRRKAREAARLASLDRCRPAALGGHRTGHRQGADRSYDAEAGSTQHGGPSAEVDDGGPPMSDRWVAAAAVAGRQHRAPARPPATEGREPTMHRPSGHHSRTSRVSPARLRKVGWRLSWPSTTTRRPGGAGPRRSASRASVAGRRPPVVPASVTASEADP